MAALRNIEPVKRNTHPQPKKMDRHPDRISDEEFHPDFVEITIWPEAETREKGRVYRIRFRIDDLKQDAAPDPGCALAFDEGETGPGKSNAPRQINKITK